MANPAQLEANSIWNALEQNVDGRVKPGHDESRGLSG
jgi:hypothetical protein